MYSALGMWEASTNPASVLHDLCALSLCSTSFPQFPSKFLSKNSIPVLAEFKGKGLCPGDKGRGGRGWELVVYMSVSLFRQKASDGREVSVW